MKRLSVIAALLCAALSFAHAQNNPYDIDDTCYEYFKMAEALVGDTSNDAFDIANNALLKRAQEVGDEKARTLHYVCLLKRVLRFARESKDITEANETADRQFKETIQVAQETGYQQYFYYAYTLIQNYYVNTRQEIHAQRLITEMMDIAARKQNEYGIWQSNIYISQLYQRQNDILNARKHLLRAVEVFDNTSDPVIRRQGFTRQCYDLAGTYPTGSDSARLFYRKAEEHALTRGDTLRFILGKAQLAAFDMQPDKYYKYRDFCLKDDTLESVIYGASALFPCIDAILDNAPIREIEVLGTKVAARSQLLYIRDLAIKYKRDDVATWFGTVIILTLYHDSYYLNNVKMEEMTAMMNERQLNMKLDNQQRLITLLWILVGIFAIVSGILVAFIISRKNNQ